MHAWKSQSSKERAARMTEDSGACVKSYDGDHFRNYRQGNRCNRI